MHGVLFFVAEQGPWSLIPKLNKREAWPTPKLYAFSCSNVHKLKNGANYKTSIIGLF